jgi:phage-related protein
MGEGLFELRLKAKEGIGRVFYCTLPIQRIMRLHVFVKKPEKTPKKELKIARTRAKKVQRHDDARRDGSEDPQRSKRQGRV